MSNQTARDVSGARATGTHAEPAAALPTDRVFPADWTVAAARDAYLRENGFTVESYDDAWTHATMFGIEFKVPNTRHHRWVLMRHDLLHTALGFGADLVGEGEISAYEAGCGLRGVGLYTGLIILSLAALGLVISPRRTLRAWRLGRGRPSLYTNAMSYAALLTLTVGELRAMLDVPPGGLAIAPRGVHPHAAPPAGG